VISNKENGLSRGLGSRTQGTDSSLLYSSSGVECPTTSYFFWTRDQVPYMIMDQMLCERRIKRNGKTQRVMERRKSSDPCGLGDDSPAIGLRILTCASGPYIRYIHFILFMRLAREGCYLIHVVGIEKNSDVTRYIEKESP